MSSRGCRLGLVVLALGLAACGRRSLKGSDAGGGEGGVGPSGAGGAAGGASGAAGGDVDGGPAVGQDADYVPPDGGPILGPFPLPACGPSPAQLLLGTQPLFQAGDAKGGPVVFLREDGVLVTRGAGRLHTRHEKEQFYGRYPANYFDGLAYGFTVEDFTAVAQQRIRVTYLPLYAPGKTMWRAWKSPGNNATFLENTLAVDVPLSPVPLTVAVAGIQSADQVTVPAGRAMAAGEFFEFELGVVSDAGVSPFTDTFRYRIAAGGMTPENRDYDQTPGPLPEAWLGGDTTIAWQHAEPEHTFGQPALNVQIDDIRDFLDGRRLFHTDFVTGANVEAGHTAFDAQAGKAGPYRNATSCASCHVRNGRGEAFTGALDATSSMAIRLYGETTLGQQLQPNEGSATAMGQRTKIVQLDEQTSVELRKPLFIVGTVAPGGMGVHPLSYSARVAASLVGLGLLEAVDDLTIAARADRGDCDGNGVSGRLGFARDPATGLTRVGRFGWKAEKTSVAHQVAEDAASSLDVGTSAIPDSAKRVTLSDTDLAKLTTYMRLIGVPAQRNAGDDLVRRGGGVFESIGCARCHLPELETSRNHPLVELRAQKIRPYTDLLLHDMGDDLADDSRVVEGLRDDAPPSAREWRTPPLWGVGLRAVVNGHAGLLHDGRAADVQQAILWHGGEGEGAKQRYVKLSPADRAAVLAFVDSL
jgi:CxxC motif-containing protein (DUF1111 family)